ncbi:MAG: YbjN domain-containing protein [Alphaproteobacteria bacterium]|nr:YbjN domain-containing protein [Alphaproteobacteria bacterium]
MTAMVLQAMDYDNPLDLAESVIMDRDWVFERPAESELLAEVSGRWCNYRVWLNWQEDSRGLMLSCSLDSKFPKSVLPKIHTLLALVNEKIWLGHFDISSEDAQVTFRHSLLLRDGAGTTQEHLNDLLDIAVSECERFFPAFQSVAWGGKTPAEALVISLFETIAEA